jgi:hypothetical protein
VLPVHSREEGGEIPPPPLKENPDAWAKPPIGTALQMTVYDHVNQKITICDSGPFTTTAPIPGVRKCRNTILEEMQNGAYKLDNVGCSLEQARKNILSAGKVFGKRTKCDTCLFLGLAYDCKWDDKDHCCTNCRDLFGRPFCSWSVDVPAEATGDGHEPGNEHEVLQANGDHDNIMRRNALVGTPTSGVIQVSEKPIMIKLDTGDDKNAGDDKDTGEDGTMDLEGAAFAAEDMGT